MLSLRTRLMKSARFENPSQEIDTSIPTAKAGRTKRSLYDLTTAYFLRRMCSLYEIPTSFSETHMLALRSVDTAKRANKALALRTRRSLYVPQTGDEGKESEHYRSTAHGQTDRHDLSCCTVLATCGQLEQRPLCRSPHPKL